MDSNKFGGQQAQQVVQGNQHIDKANIAYGADNTPALFRKITLDLSVERTLANPMIVGFAFKTIHVSGVNDDSAFVNFQVNSAEENNSDAPLYNKDVMIFDHQVKNCIITWPAQPGKQMTIHFYISSEFYTGSNVIDLKSQANAFNVGGLTLQSNELNCILMTTINPTGSAIPAGEQYLSKTQCTNNPSYNNGSGIFTVPVGMEFIVNSISKMNLKPVSASVIDTTFLKCTQTDTTTPNALYPSGDPVIETEFYLFNALTTSYNKFAMTIVQDEPTPFPWGLRNAVDSQTLCIVDEGKAVAGLVENDASSGVDPDPIIQIQITGYLRTKV